MPLFKKKKPDTFTALCWDDDTSAGEIIRWIINNGQYAMYYCKHEGACVRDEHNIAIFRLENPEEQYIHESRHASRGDWIIKDVQGEFYPCKPDIFEATYEPAEEAV